MAKPALKIYPDRIARLVHNFLAGDLNYFYNTPKTCVFGFLSFRLHQGLGYKPKFGIFALWTALKHRKCINDKAAVFHLRGLSHNRKGKKSSKLSMITNGKLEAY